MAQIVLALVLIVAGALVLMRGVRALSRSESGAAADARPNTHADEAGEPRSTRTEPGRYLALAGVALVAVGILALLT